MTQATNVQPLCRVCGKPTGNPQCEACGMTNSTHSMKVAYGSYVPAHMKHKTADEIIAANMAARDMRELVIALRVESDWLESDSLIDMQPTNRKETAADIRKASDTIDRLAADLAKAKEQLAAVPDSPTWPIVLAFALKMEAKLDKNRHKGDAEGWRKDDPFALHERLCQESNELSDAIGLGSAEQITAEAADVANFAMMIADVATLAEIAP